MTLPLTPYILLCVYALLLLWLNNFSLSTDFGDKFDRVFVLPFALIGGVLAFGTGLGISAALTDQFAHEMDSEPSSTAELVSLRSADGISGSFSGSFFLGHGSIGSEMYYFYYVKSGYAVSPRKHLAGIGTYIYEQERRDGKVYIYGWHFKSPFAKWFAFKPNGTTTYFYVPTGSILRGFKL